MTDRKKEKPTLLSGGNPQIPKGTGPGPVRDYIAAMPDRKRDIGRELDELIESVVPDVRKAVKWNQPFYGADEDGWFLSFRCYTRYVQVQFLRGTELDPPPPKASKHDRVRYVDLHEGEDLNTDLLRSWVQQAARLPSEKM